MANIEHLNKVKELNEQGKSIRQIAAELNISKSTVARLIGQSGNAGIEMPIASIASSRIDNESPNHNKANKMDNQNDHYKIEREIALKKMQLDHELELRKLAHQEKELELRKREMELKHLEKDAITRQQQIEENKIKHQVKKWQQEEMQLFEAFAYGEIELSVAGLQKRVKTLYKLIDLLEEHYAIYGYDADEQIHYSNLTSFLTFLSDILESAESELEEDDEPAETAVAYDWSEDQVELLENLEDFEFFK